VVLLQSLSQSLLSIPSILHSRPSLVTHYHYHCLLLLLLLLPLPPANQPAPTTTHPSSHTPPRLDVIPRQRKRLPSSALYRSCAVHSCLLLFSYSISLSPRFHVLACVPAVSSRLTTCQTLSPSHPRRHVSAQNGRLVRQEFDRPQSVFAKRRPGASTCPTSLHHSFSPIPDLTLFLACRLATNPPPSPQRLVRLQHANPLAHHPRLRL
jgi:hypothetical protein